MVWSTGRGEIPPHSRDAGQGTVRGRGRPGTLAGVGVPLNFQGRFKTRW